MNVALRLPAQRNAPASARRALASLTPYVGAEIYESAELLVSELVTNSVRHADLGANDCICVTASVGHEVLYVEVSDPGSGFDPRVREPEGPQTGGYGLFLVAELAVQWGVEANGMTRVWFELPVA